MRSGIARTSRVVAMILRAAARISPRLLSPGTTRPATAIGSTVKSSRPSRTATSCRRLRWTGGSRRGWCPSPALSKNGYRLPTEAEWEYACRAGTESSYFFGNDSSLLVFYALIEGSETSPVGQFRPNAFGLHDTYSNVTEWCHDPESQYRPRIDGCAKDDCDLGIKQAYQVRGGNPSNLHLANSYARQDMRYSNGLSFRGFRLARTLPIPLPAGSSIVQDH